MNTHINAKKSIKYQSAHMLTHRLKPIKHKKTVVHLNKMKVKKKGWKYLLQSSRSKYNASTKLITCSV